MEGRGTHTRAQDCLSPLLGYRLKLAGMKITVFQPQHGLALVHHGRLTWGEHTIDCALGKAGITGSKTEGDHATPVGMFPLRRLLYRSDRLNRPDTRLPAMAIRPNLGWCDDVASPAYNRLVRRPCPWRHETLWREDCLYDLVVVLGHNDAPPVPAMGSAVFLHVAADNLAPTEGCVAIPTSNLIALIEKCGPGDTLEIQAPH